MKKRLLFASPFIWVIFLLLLLAQCKKPELNIPNPNPNPVPGQPITDEQRLVVMDAVKNAFSILHNTDPTNALPSLLLFLQSQPAFEASGLTDSSRCAWARFTDGRLLIIANNREPSEFENRGGRLSFEPEASGGRIGELPEKGQVLLLNAMGSAFINSPPQIKPIFEGKGYQVSIGDASVEGLKKINTEDNAIFFMDTHGGDGNTRVIMSTIDGKVIYKKRYGFWTTDTTSLANEKKFADDLNKERLVYFIASKDEPTKGQITNESHYAFTEKFVKEYMKFGKNSMIYLEACGSYNNDMIIAFRDKSKDQESVYLGWTYNCGDKTGYRAAKFMFDRLLGANMLVYNPALSIPKEEPSQRPFDIDAVHKDLVDRGFNQFKYTEANLVIISKLQYRSTIGTSAGEDPRFILAPSISYLEIEELESELTINGIFGKDPGESNREVRVNEVLVQSIKSWEKDKIVCKIPYQGNGSAGEVVVSVRGHKSNPVPLTEWKIDMTIKQGQTLTTQATLALHLRADVHRFREKPGEKDPKRVKTPVPETFPLIPNSFAKDSKASFIAQGNCSWSCPGACGTIKQSLTGSRDLLIKNSLFDETGFGARYGWSEKRDKMELLLDFYIDKAYKFRTISTPCQGKGTDTTINSAYVVLTLDQYQKVPEMKFANPDQFDFTINAGNKTFVMSSAPSCKCLELLQPEAFLEWKVSKPNFPPTDKTPARMGLVE